MRLFTLCLRIMDLLQDLLIVNGNQVVIGRPPKKIISLINENNSYVLNSNYALELRNEVQNDNKH